VEDAASLCGKKEALHEERLRLLHQLAEEEAAAAAMAASGTAPAAAAAAVQATQADSLDAFMSGQLFS
jgi:hypothetical protein